VVRTVEHELRLVASSQPAVHRTPRGVRGIAGDHRVVTRASDAQERPLDGAEAGAGCGIVCGIPCGITRPFAGAEAGAECDESPRPTIMRRGTWPTITRGGKAVGGQVGIGFAGDRLRQAGTERVPAKPTASSRTRLHRPPRSRSRCSSSNAK